MRHMHRRNLVEVLIASTVVACASLPVEAGLLGAPRVDGSLWASEAVARPQPGMAIALAQAASVAASGPQSLSGTLTALRSIAVDTLNIARAGDLAAARKRLEDLERGWRRDSPQIKSAAPDHWRALDAAIDRAERELRFWRARRTDSVAALEELVRTFDSLN